MAGWWFFDVVDEKFCDTSKFVKNGSYQENDVLKLNKSIYAACLSHFFRY